MLARITQALFEHNQDALAFDRMDRHWGEMVRRGATCFWEIFDSRWPAGLWPHKLWSTAHGWSSGVVGILQRYVLGARATGPGGTSWVIAPRPGPLMEAQGTVPTVAGPLHVRWTRRGRNLKLDVKAPRGVRWEAVR